MNFNRQKIITPNKTMIKQSWIKKNIIFNLIVDLIGEKNSFPMERLRSPVFCSRLWVYEASSDGFPLSSIGLIFVLLQGRGAREASEGILEEESACFQKYLKRWKHGVPRWPFTVRLLQTSVLKEFNSSAISPMDVHSHLSILSSLFHCKVL